MFNIDNDTILKGFQLNQHKILDRLEWPGTIIRTAGNLYIVKDTLNVLISKQQQKIPCSPSIPIVLLTPGTIRPPVPDWRFVCHHSSSYVYLCFSINYQKELKTSGDILQAIEKGWYGQKYDKKGRLLYQGDFRGFFRHHLVHSSFEIQYNLSGHIEGIFKGKFCSDLKHDQRGELLTRTESVVGIWQKDNKQGEFTFTENKGIESIINKKKNKFNKYTNKNFTNDMQTQKPKQISLPLKPFLFDEMIRHNIAISESLYYSLNPNQWLESSAVDLFFKHLDKSYADFPTPKRGIKCFTVYMFEKMIPSSKVYDPNYNIDCEAVREVSGALSNAISIFQQNPVILFPLNQNRSHFVLAAICSQVKRSYKKDKSSKVESVEFKLYHLDPMGCKTASSTTMFKHLCNFIQKEISKISQNDQDAYKAALDSIERNAATSKISSKNFDYTKQDNFDDCGAFTCIYGALLVIEKGLGIKVNWSRLASSVKALRKLIQKDILNEGRNLLGSLIDIFIENNVIETQRGDNISQHPKQLVQRKYFCIRESEPQKNSGRMT